MAKISGTFVIVSLEDEANPGTFIPLGCQSSGTLNIDGETADVTCKGDGGWGSFITTRKNWSVDVDGFMDFNDTANGGHTLADAIMNNKIVKVDFGIEPGHDNYSGSIYFEGDAVTANVSISAPDNDGTTYSGSLTGYGELIKGTRV